MKRIFLISLLFFLAGYCLAQEGTNFEILPLKKHWQNRKTAAKNYS